MLARLFPGFSQVLGLCGENSGEDHLLDTTGKKFRTIQDGDSYPPTHISGAPVAPSGTVTATVRRKKEKLREGIPLGVFPSPVSHPVIDLGPFWGR